ncbi:MAG: preprotein translocase subunit SecY [Bacteroidetes bacterium]|jgi:preprotein translocase subunit SecY|nr:preprotein translocase subunit SecY [Bacteroidota bacterium]MDA8930498.1 preprotein translocase subunit SecY [Bacteroidia bacterium]
MNKFISTLKNIFSIEDLRTRIINLVLLLVVYRIGTFIVIPGVDPLILLDPEIYGNKESGGFLGLVNTFSGGAFDRVSIFALGIMPYISASIVIQLLTVAVPAFQKMQKDGEDGRRKINAITRYLTIAITAVQGIAYLINLKSTNGTGKPLALMTDVLGWGMFLVVGTLVLVAGTMFTVWLGERITDRGVGNGISILIMVGIIARLPATLLAEMVDRGQGGEVMLLIVELVVWVVVILAVIALVQATRRIPVQYAKRIVGNRQTGGVRQYLPLKVNAAGVMPIIFAQALMFLPGSLLGLPGMEDSSFLMSLSRPDAIGYNILTFVLIVLFTYFYTAITINPNQIAADLKKNGGFIPGVKPGRKTANFIGAVMSRITLPGSVFLGLVAIFPYFAIKGGVNDQFAQFYGGTSLLIMVGVVLDTLQQVEQYLIMRHYDGLMKTGRIKGRSSVGGAMTG